MYVYTFVYRDLCIYVCCNVYHLVGGSRIVYVLVQYICVSSLFICFCDNCVVV